MSNVSKEIYRKITTLIPDLNQIEPFHKVELKDRGYPGIEFTVIESNTNKINFILSRYEKENGQLIANPSIEIVAKPGKKVANVKTYKDIDYIISTRQCQFRQKSAQLPSIGLTDSYLIS